MFDQNSKNLNISLKLKSFFKKHLNYLLKYSFNLVYSSNFDRLFSAFPLFPPFKPVIRLGIQ